MYLGQYKTTNQHLWKSKTGVEHFREIKGIICIFKCDKCNVQFERKAGGIAKERISNDYKHFCSSCGKDKAYLTSLGHEKIRENRRKQIGQKTIDHEGYMRIVVGPDYQGAGYYGGCVREHILVMQEKLGRHLIKGEVVHHIDGDKTNNNPENLDICTVQEHNKCHATTELLVFELYKQGIIGYNSKTKRYYLKDQIH